MGGSEIGAIGDLPPEMQERFDVIDRELRAILRKRGLARKWAMYRWRRRHRRNTTPHQF